MKARWTKSLFTLLALTGLLVGCANQGAGGGGTAGSEPAKEAAAGSGEKIVLRFPHIVDEKHAAHLAALDFEKEVEEKSKGRIDIQIFPNGQLYGSDREIIEAIQMGNVEMSIVGTPSLGSFKKDFTVLDLPFIFKDKETARKALDGELGQKLFAGMADINLKGLAYGYDGFRHVLNNKQPIKSPADFKGLKIRVLESKLHQDIFNTLGANASPLSFGELYTALQQKTYDGMDNSVAIIYTSKFYEVQKYMTLSNHVYSGTMMLMSNEVFNNLPKDLQEIVQDASDHMKQKYYGLVDKDNEEMLVKLKEAGLDITELTSEQHQAFVDAVKPVYDQYSQELGKELVDLARSSGQ